jgi:hypothetical protein
VVQIYNTVFSAINQSVDGQNLSQHNMKFDSKLQHSIKRNYWKEIKWLNEWLRFYKMVNMKEKIGEDLNSSKKWSFQLKDIILATMPPIIFCFAWLVGIKNQIFYVDHIIVNLTFYIIFFYIDQIIIKYFALYNILFFRDKIFFFYFWLNWESLKINTSLQN